MKAAERQGQDTQVPLGHQAEPPALGSRSQSPRKLCLYRVVGSTRPDGSISGGKGRCPQTVCVYVGQAQLVPKQATCVRAGISPRCSGMRAPPCGWRFLVTQPCAHAGSHGWACFLPSAPCTSAPESPRAPRPLSDLDTLIRPQTV